MVSLGEQCNDENVLLGETVDHESDLGTRNAFFFFFFGEISEHTCVLQTPLFKCNIQKRVQGHVWLVCYNRYAGA